MVIVRADSLVPPRDLIRGSDSIIVVSSKRPVCVYFDKAMDEANSRMFSAVRGSVVEINFAAAGGAISRCEQVARYTVQSLRTKYKHVVTNVEKLVSRGETETSDINFPDNIVDEETLLNSGSVRRSVRTIRITLKISIG
jgi:hypothetical protein